MVRRTQGVGPGSGVGVEVAAVPVNLTQVIAQLKAVSPALATNLRRRLRGVGDEIIAGQRAILSGPLPGNAVVVGKKVRLVSRGGKGAYLRRVNVYGSQAALRHRSNRSLYTDNKNNVRRVKTKTADGRTATKLVSQARKPETDRGRRHAGMRAAIKSSLKTRVVAGKTRSGIEIRADRSVGGPMTMVWNKKLFRHPVFARGSQARNDRAWVSQFGQPYWWGPIQAGAARAKAQAQEAIAEALARIPKNTNS